MEDRTKQHAILTHELILMEELGTANMYDCFISFCLFIEGLVQDTSTRYRLGLEDPLHRNTMVY